MLYPRHSDDCVTDISALADCLRDAGFIGEALDAGHFLPGDQFLSLLSFLGCSPNIRLHPEDGEQFCHVHITEPKARAECLGFTSNIRPGCPACKQRLTDWRSASGWRYADGEISCPKCAGRFRMDGLRWRQECGYGRSAIEVAWIHPHEAVPAEKLLSILERHSDFDWTYCYASDRINDAEE